MLILEKTIYFFKIILMYFILDNFLIITIQYVLIRKQKVKEKIYLSAR